jgi:integrase
MSSRRSRGDGGLHWDQSRQRWVATATLGYDGRGKRLVRHGYGRTKTDAKAKLRDLLRSREDGVVLTRDGYTVCQAVEDWLEHGLSGRDKATRDANRHLCQKHVLPHLGARKLRDLTATEVDEWLATLATSLSTRTLQGVRACLNRAVRRAMARDKVKRNVVELTEVPAGLPGRPSKAMTAQQADDVITKTASDRMHSYVVVSLLTGARTEELRALRWEHVHLEGRPDVTPPIPPFVEVWRSVPAGGDTKTMKSAERSHFRICASGRSSSAAHSRMPNAVPLASNGTRQAWCSRLGSVPRWMLRTCAGTSAVPWRQFLA